MPEFFSRLLLLLLMLPAGGFIDSAQASNSALPIWIAQPPSDTPNTMWGTGEGSDLDSAKRSALKDIAAKLRVAISARVESTVTVSLNSVDKFARTRMIEDVQRTEFKNYKLEKSEIFGNIFYALVSVDRRIFIAEAEQKLAAAENEIAIRLAGSEAGPGIERFIAQQKALPWLEKAVASAQLLAAADPKFDGLRFINHEVALAKAKSSAKELIFEIKSADNNPDVAKTLRNFLNESGMRIGNGGTALIIATEAVQDTIFGEYTVQLRINLGVLDSKKRNLASKEFVARGSSVSDHRMARQAALNNLMEMLRAAGPLLALGFSLDE